MTIFRYPLSPPVSGNTDVDNPTKEVDYVMFQRKRIQYDDQNSNAYYGLNIPDNKVKMNLNPDRVYIAMPQNLSTQYQPTYRQIDVGVAGMAMAQNIGAKDFDTAAKALQQAADNAIPELITGTLADITTGAAQFLGLAGNASANDILALSRGKVFNPYTEQLYSNMQFRNHIFSFKFFARNDRESREINKIIKYLKKGALPKYGSSTNLSIEGNRIGGAKVIDDLLGRGGAARFFEVPDKFDIKFIRLDPRSDSLTVSKDLHYKIHTSVCSGIDVNYTPDGQYNAIKTSRGRETLGVTDNAPLQVPAVTMNCRFTETQLVTQSQIDEGF